MKKPVLHRPGALAMGVGQWVETCRAYLKCAPSDVGFKTAYREAHGEITRKERKNLLQDPEAYDAYARNAFNKRVAAPQEDGTVIYEPEDQSHLPPGDSDAPRIPPFALSGTSFIEKVIEVRAYLKENPDPTLTYRYQHWFRQVCGSYTAHSLLSLDKHRGTQFYDKYGSDPITDRAPKATPFTGKL